MMPMTSPTADEHRHGQHRRDARAGRVRYFIGFGGEGDERVDLLGHLHRADLGRDGGGDAARDHQAAEDGAELADHADGDDGGHDGFGVEARAAGVDLQRERAAGEERGEADDGEAEVADEPDLLAASSLRVEGRADDVADASAPAKIAMRPTSARRPRTCRPERREEASCPRPRRSAAGSGCRGEVRIS